MNAAQLFLALERIDDRFVLESEQAPKRASRRWIAAAAAAVFVVLGAAMAVHFVLAPHTAPLQSLRQPASTPAAESETVPPVESAAVQQTLPDDTTMPSAEPTIILEHGGPVIGGSDAIWPAKIGGTYQHTGQGDFITLMEVPSFGRPTETFEITGQLIDGYYSGEQYYSVPGCTVTIELQVHPDGGYDLSIWDGHLSWTNHDPPWPPADWSDDVVIVAEP